MNHLDKVITAVDDVRMQASFLAQGLAEISRAELSRPHALVDRLKLAQARNLAIITMIEKAIELAVQPHATERILCGDVSPSGRLCTRKPGHEGMHQDQDVIWTVAQEEKAS